MNKYSTALALAGAILLSQAGFAKDKSCRTLAPFCGSDENSKYEINYGDYSKILAQTVWDTGPSNRQSAGKVTPRAGSRIVRGSRSSNRLEGNKVDFHAFIGKNKGVLAALRNDLASAPDTVPLGKFSKNDQLAYWLNLYNLTLLSLIADIFPESRLEDHYQSSGERLGLWDEKVITVSGVELSLNDIHHKIIIPKWQGNPEVMYGLFQGVIGGPNLRDEAYTGRRVWRQLRDNARDFVNSNRGAFIRDRIIRTSMFYDINRSLFPDFNRDLKRHLIRHAKPRFAEKLQRASDKIGTGQSNWDIADLYGGSRALSSANTNVAALITGMRTGSDNGSVQGGQFSGDAYTGALWAQQAQAQNMHLSRFPIHLVTLTKKTLVKNRKLRHGQVEVEEYSPETATAPQAQDGTQDDKN